MKSVNPFNLETIREYQAMSSDHAISILKKTQQTWNKWKFSSMSTRSDYLMSASRVLKERKDEFARLMMNEMGKRLSDGISEVEKCAWVCEYYARNGEEFLEPKVIKSDASQSYISYRPLGVVLAIMPWNFPFWQVFRFLAPALMAGNAAVLKHASNVMGCALAIEDVIRQAGFPEDLFRTLLLSSSEVNTLIDHEVVKAVTLTGSTPAGRAVASAAGNALKKCVLELGGSDPYVILDDADIPQAVTTCSTSRLINAGQSCIAAKRFIVTDKNYNRFLELMREEMRSRKLGDPADPDTDIGPMARLDLRDELHGQVQESIAAGARCILGGEIPELKGAFYPPTILVDVQPGMPAFDDELFGPVAAVIRASNEEEAMKLANQTVFGLGAAVFTENSDHGRKLAEYHMDAGCCFVNEFVRSDPRLPFGGIKQSGYGRELSMLGIHEFVNAKTVYVK